MANIEGTGGAVTIDGFVTKFTAWTASLNGEVFNSTGFGDAGWQVESIITGQVVGQAIGVITTDIVCPAAVMNETFGVATMEGTVLLTFAAGKTWSFEAAISTLDLGRAETGAGTSTYAISFRSSGEVTQSWA